MSFTRSYSISVIPDPLFALPIGVPTPVVRSRLTISPLFEDAYNMPFTAASFVITTVPQLSVPIAVGKHTSALHNPGSLLTIISAGQVITGGSVSFTVTLNVQELVLPVASVAVTVTSVVPTGNVLPEAGTLEVVTPGQLSVVVDEKVTTASHWPGILLTVISAGQVTTGASVSFTVTLKVQELVFPEASVAVTVTSVVPTGNTVPEAGTLEDVTPGQLSVAVGEKVTTASH